MEGWREGGRAGREGGKGYYDLLVVFLLGVRSFLFAWVSAPGPASSVFFLLRGVEGFFGGTFCTTLLDDTLALQVSNPVHLG